MQRVAFKMKLNFGQEEEYKKRHDSLWPELQELLKGSGISNYSIFLDPETLHLFAVMEIENKKALDGLSNHPIMKRWWEYMKDVMETNEDFSPTSISMKEVFYLP